MISRVTRFMTVCPFHKVLEDKSQLLLQGTSRVRNRVETLQILASQWFHAKQIGGLASIKRSRTAEGIKDTFQGHFIERLTNVSRIRGQTRESKENAMNQLLSTFPKPDDLTLSPVWRIKGEQHSC